MADAGPPQPFPDSLCHRCDAPARYVTSDRGTIFVHCPRQRRYPPQPVRACADFHPLKEPPE